MLQGYVGHSLTASAERGEITAEGLMPIPMPPVRTLFLALLLAPVSCGSDQRPAESAHEVTGSQLERVAAVSKLMQATAPLPGILMDAHFLEERTGDGEIGPSDYTAFAALRIAPADVPRWRAELPALDSLGGRPQFVTPRRPRDWWVSAAVFPSLEFFSAATITPRTNGWVGVHAASGTIFIFSFTQ